MSDDKTQILGYLKTVYPTADNFIHEGSLYSLNMDFPFVIRVCVIVLSSLCGRLSCNACKGRKKTNVG